MSGHAPAQTEEFELVAVLEGGTGHSTVCHQRPVADAQIEVESGAEGRRDPGRAGRVLPGESFAKPGK